ncbi:SxtJ family membrane protein [Alteromonas sp. ASW11-36]|uniref:SxtJ family membrane protein n=1 Tax=Alteromonas arenosi TaxID=3055817 RepID=A0ABT7SXH8_9ALTE|nr:SxtJ family membrane protein [Alteromonas sp. ASW11-36]MDM7860704.1 SxtJ family membrane protein [Alteromonas sp. ASW11-36]
MLSKLKSIMLPMADPSDSSALRQFAVQMSVAFPLFFALLLPWIFDHAMPYWPFLVSVALLTGGFVIPRILYPMYVVWMIIASVLGWLNTQLILGLAFFILILPLGLVLRLFNKLGYSSKINKNVSSYWITRQNPPRKENLKEPF